MMCTAAVSAAVHIIYVVEILQREKEDPAAAGSFFHVEVSQQRESCALLPKQQPYSLLRELVTHFLEVVASDPLRLLLAWLRLLLALQALAAAPA